MRKWCFCSVWLDGKGVCGRAGLVIHACLLSCVLAWAKEVGFWEAWRIWGVRKGREG